MTFPPICDPAGGGGGGGGGGFGGGGFGGERAPTPTATFHQTCVCQGAQPAAQQQVGLVVSARTCLDPDCFVFPTRRGDTCGVCIPTFDRIFCQPRSFTPTCIPGGCWPFGAQVGGAGGGGGMTFPPVCDPAGGGGGFGGGGFGGERAPTPTATFHQTCVCQGAQPGAQQQVGLVVSARTCLDPDCFVFPTRRGDTCGVCIPTFDRIFCQPRSFTPTCIPGCWQGAQVGGAGGGGFGGPTPTATFPPVCPDPNQAQAQQQVGLVVSARTCLDPDCFVFPTRRGDTCGVCIPTFDRIFCQPRSFTPTCLPGCWQGAQVGGAGGGGFGGGFGDAQAQPYTIYPQYTCGFVCNTAYPPCGGHQQAQGGGGFGGPTPTATFPPVCHDPGQAQAQPYTVYPQHTCGFVCNTAFPPCGGQQDFAAGGGFAGPGAGPIQPTLTAQTCIQPLCQPTLFGATCPVCPPTLTGQTCPLCPPTIVGRTCPRFQCFPTFSGQTCPVFQCHPTIFGTTCPLWTCRPTFVEPQCFPFGPGPVIRQPDPFNPQPEPPGVGATGAGEAFAAVPATLNNATCLCPLTIIGRTCPRFQCFPTLTGQTCPIFACRPTLFGRTCPIWACRPTISDWWCFQAGPAPFNPQPDPPGVGAGEAWSLAVTCPPDRCGF